MLLVSGCMGRFILILLLVPSVLLAFFTAVDPVVSTAYVPSISIPQTTTQTQNNFEQIGVLTFYPNNTGPVPYLFYSNARGNTESKALVFETVTTNNLSSWGASRVTIVGTLHAEHVVVSSIRYVSGP